MLPMHRVRWHALGVRFSSNSLANENRGGPNEVRT